MATKKLWMAAMAVMIALGAVESAHAQLNVQLKLMTEAERDSFPLWGETWVVANGVSPRIYQSVLPFAPKTVVKIQFPQNEPDDSVIIQWANLNHNDYPSTAHAIEAMRDTLKDHKLAVCVKEIGSKRDSSISIRYKGLQDTVWSLDSAISSLIGSYESCELIQGARTTTFYPPYSWSGQYPNDPRCEEQRCIEEYYTREKPTAWLKRRYNQALDDIGTVFTKVTGVGGPNRMWFKDINSDYTEYLASDPANPGDPVAPAYYYKKVDRYSSRISPSLYWQIHVYPEVWFYPRDTYSGTPVIKDARKACYDSAYTWKQRSFQATNDSTFWRNPYYSDSASTVISFAFTLRKKDYEDNPVTEISLNSIDETTSAAMYAHTSRYMAKWDEADDGKKALYTLYADSAELSFAQSLDTRCGDWMTADKNNAGEIFICSDDPIRGQQVCTRKRGAKDGVFMYNGCPSEKLRNGGLTKAELRKYIYKPTPTCRYDEMVTAYNAYMKLYNGLPRYKLDDPIDQRIIYDKMRQLHEAMNSQRAIRKGIAARDTALQGLSEAQLDNYFQLREKRCPASPWVAELKRELGM